MNRWSRNAVLSTRALDTDPWDQREFRVATKNLRSYSNARRSLEKVASTGGDALADAFFALSKANPEVLPATELRPSHLVNRLVASQLLQSPSTRRLRDHTVGDPVQAALGCVTLAPMLESIFDRLALEQDLAEELQQHLKRLSELRDELDDTLSSFDEELGEDPSDEDVERALQSADDLRAARAEVDAMEQDLEQRAQTLEEHLDDCSPAVRDAMRDAVSEAADGMQSTAMAAMAWGLNPGELRQLSAGERLKLAKKLNGERMREIAELFGRIRNLSFSDAVVVSEELHDEIIDLELGGDLGRVVPAELLLLGDPATETDFLSRMADGELLQYSVQGSDELGRGGIVMCVDGSGSMTGAAELWSKAVMLVLMHEARAQKRTMHVIHFGSAGQFKHIGFTEPGDFTAARIMEAAAAFYGGGTDFHTPMDQALEILIEEFARTGSTRADVVFATDDECQVAPHFMDRYLAEMRRMGARTYGLEMSGSQPSATGALSTMSEGRVVSVKDLRSGRDIRAMLRALR